MSISRNVAISAQVCRQWLSQTFEITANQQQIMDVFFQDAVQLLFNHHEINEQVLTDLVLDLAESFQANWNEEEGLFHGCMEFILEHVDENAPKG
jgi:hypothetical protein